MLSVCVALRFHMAISINQLIVNAVCWARRRLKLQDHRLKGVAVCALKTSVDSTSGRIVQLGRGQADLDSTHKSRNERAPAFALMETL